MLYGVDFLFERWVLDDGFRWGKKALDKGGAWCLYWGYWFMDSKGLWGGGFVEIVILWIQGYYIMFNDEILRVVCEGRLRNFVFFKRKT